MTGASILTLMVMFKFGWNVSDDTTLDLIVRHQNTDTGVDALTHSLESLLSRNGNPFAEAMAVGVIRTVQDWLPRAVADGADLDPSDSASQHGWHTSVCRGCAPPAWAVLIKLSNRRS